MQRAAFRDVFKNYSDAICFVLDIRLCNFFFFFYKRYITNKHKYMNYSQGSCGVSSNNYGRLEEFEEINGIFCRFLVC